MGDEGKFERMTAEVRGRLPKDCDGIVLVLHGGGEHGEHALRWSGLPVLRMLPFAWALRRRGGRRIGVLRVKNAVFGWNGDKRSPIAGIREVLDRVRAQRPGVPIVLLGHSMGGRVALNLIEEPDVAGVVALAPWVVESDGVHGRPGQRALVMHGLRDRITSPVLAERLVERLRGRGVEATWLAVPGGGHAMLRHSRLWHRTASRFAIETLRRARTRTTAGSREGSS